MDWVGGGSVSMVVVRYPRDIQYTVAIDILIPLLLIIL